MTVLAADIIICKDYKIYFNHWEQLSDLVHDKKYSKVICIVDDNTQKHCLPILKQRISTEFDIIIIKSGEKYKTIDTCSKIWKEMMHLGADRQSLVIALGGGVVGDMGGFCASTYMRGIDFVQVPTTLLSQVDAAVGGKLGVDLDGYKNMIGMFQSPVEVHVFPEFVISLPNRELLSGFAEMIKHALVSDISLWNSIKAIHPITESDWTDHIVNSVIVKHKITEIDPYERAERKTLNFGHTIGHAVESENLNNEYPLLHGEAIAIGMICESHISYQKGLLDQATLEEITQYITTLYDLHPEAVVMIDNIIEHTYHDKKNNNGQVLCTLLSNIGSVVLSQSISEQEIRNAIVYYRDL